MEITGWAFKSTEPTAYQGLIWIGTSYGSSVDFNALCSNDIHVYPTRTKQYVDGTWVDVTTRYYQNGEWLNSVLSFSVEKSKWTESNVTATTSLSYSNGVFSYKVTLKNGWTQATLQYTDLIDCSNMTTLSLVGNGTITIQSNSSKHQLILTDGTNTVLTADIESFTDKFSVDVSALSGSYYLKIYSYVGSYSSTVLNLTGIEIV